MEINIRFSNWEASGSEGSLEPPPPSKQMAKQLVKTRPWGKP